MEEPRSDLKSDERGDPPDFDGLTPPEELVRGERTRDDFLDAVLQLDDPATVEEFASLAGHGTDAAREYLNWFERMGIVEQVTDTPATYRRNDEFLIWRRVQRLRNAYDSAELLDFLETETERNREFVEEFGVESPAEVAISQFASETDQSVDAVWESLSEWKTTRRRIGILERALAETDEGPQRSVA